MHHRISSLCLLTWSEEIVEADLRLRFFADPLAFFLPPGGAGVGAPNPVAARGTNVWRSDGLQVGTLACQRRGKRNRKAFELHSLLEMVPHLQQ